MVLDERFLDWLAEMFPAKDFSAKSTEREDCFNAGLQHFVVVMRRTYNDQQERAREQLGQAAVAP